MPTTVIGASSGIDITTLKCTGRGTCDGGVNPGPPLHDFPLLAWKHDGHHQHVRSVFTEDQKASVPEIATALAGNQSVEALAARFGTTPDHVTQAIQYAVQCGYLAS